MIRVLIVEDSPVCRELLTHILGSEPDIYVVGTAQDGQEAIEAVKRKKPDVVTMDVNMPKMNGFEATRRIMEVTPTPIVIVSASWDPQEVENTFRAVEAGALAMVEKPMGIGHPAYMATAKELVQTVKLMSEVKVVRRWPRPQLEKGIPTASPEMRSRRTGAEIQLVAMGASTGGPVALQTILSGLPRDFPVPLLIVQHIASGFIQGFVEWLAESSGFPVHLAVHGEHPLSGHAYVAPEGFHVRVERDGRIALSQDEPEHGLRPSVSYLFRSVAEVLGQNAVGVLLTGMGRDGAEELRTMKEKGAITIVQDKESSVIHGMPGEAIKLDAAMYVLGLDTIAAALANLVA